MQEQVEAALSKIIEAAPSSSSSSSSSSETTEREKALKGAEAAFSKILSQNSNVTLHALATLAANSEKETPVRVEAAKQFHKHTNRIDVSQLTSSQHIDAVKLPLMSVFEAETTAVPLPVRRAVAASIAALFSRLSEWCNEQKSILQNAFPANQQAAHSPPNLETIAQYCISFWQGLLDLATEGGEEEQGSLQKILILFIFRVAATRLLQSTFSKQLPQIVDMVDTCLNDEDAELRTAAFNLLISLIEAASETDDGSTYCPLLKQLTPAMFSAIEQSFEQRHAVHCARQINFCRIILTNYEGSGVNIFEDSKTELFELSLKLIRSSEKDFDPPSVVANKNSSSATSASGSSSSSSSQKEQKQEEEEEQNEGEEEMTEQEFEEEVERRYSTVLKYACAAVTSLGAAYPKWFRTKKELVRKYIDTCYALILRDPHLKDDDFTYRYQISSKKNEIDAKRKKAEVRHQKEQARAEAAGTTFGSLGSDLSKGEEAFDGTDSIFDCGSQSLDKIAELLPAPFVKKTIVATALENLVKPDPIAQASAITAICYIAEHQKELVGDLLHQFIVWLVQTFEKQSEFKTDDESLQMKYDYLRFCGIRAAAQFMADFVPGFQTTFASKLLPLLFNEMQSSSVFQCALISAGALAGFFNDLDDHRNEESEENREDDVKLIEQFIDPCACAAMASLTAQDNKYASEPLYLIDVVKIFAALSLIAEKRVKTYAVDHIPILLRCIDKELFGEIVSSENSILAKSTAGSHLPALVSKIPKEHKFDLCCKTIESLTIALSFAKKAPFDIPAGLTSGLLQFITRNLKQHREHRELLDHLLRAVTCCVEGCDSVAVKETLKSEEGPWKILLEFASAQCQRTYTDLQPGEEIPADTPEFTYLRVSAGPGMEKLCTVKVQELQSKSLSLCILSSVVEDLGAAFACEKEWIEELTPIIVQALNFDDENEIRTDAVCSLGSIAKGIKKLPVKDGGGAQAVRDWHSEHDVIGNILDEIEDNYDAEPQFLIMFLTEMDKVFQSMAFDDDDDQKDEREKKKKERSEEKKKETKKKKKEKGEEEDENDNDDDDDLPIDPADVDKLMQFLTYLANNTRDRLIQLNSTENLLRRGGGGDDEDEEEEDEEDDDDEDDENGEEDTEDELNQLLYLTTSTIGNVLKLKPSLYAGPTGVACLGMMRDGFSRWQAIETKIDEIKKAKKEAKSKKSSSKKNNNKKSSKNKSGGDESLAEQDPELLAHQNAPHVFLAALLACDMFETIPSSIILKLIHPGELLQMIAVIAAAAAHTAPDETCNQTLWYCLKVAIQSLASVVSENPSLQTASSVTSLIANLENYCTKYLKEPTFDPVTTDEGDAVYANCVSASLQLLLHFPSALQKKFALLELIVDSFESLDGDDDEIKYVVSIMCCWLAEKNNFWFAQKQELRQKTVDWLVELSDVFVDEKYRSFIAQLKSGK